MRLTVTPRDGLVVVVPRYWSGDVAAIVAEKRAWAERALARVAEKHALHAAGAEALLPHEVELRVAGRTLPVEYRSTPATRTQARVGVDGSLVVSGDIDDADACLAALTRWLDRESRALLLPLLGEVAAQSGVAYASARVRRQRTRWGSCSAKKTISLSRNLVFLPPELVGSLMLHELAHTRVMNHSARFWRELERLDPLAREHREAMRNAQRFVPAWAEP